MNIIFPKVLILIKDKLESKYISDILSTKGYSVSVLHEGKEVMTALFKKRPDLLILDLNLKGINGFHILKWIRKDQRLEKLPVIIIAELSSEKIKAFEEGADDVVLRPIDLNELSLRVKSVVRINNLLSQLKESEEVLFMIAKSIERREPYKKEHLERVMMLSLILGQSLELPFRELEILKRSALLHDIGKIYIPDSVLNKPEPLEREELNLISQHPRWGHNIVKKMRFLGKVPEIIRAHHERWDGSGYPDGLIGKEIPFLARILSIADAYDALTRDRPHREAYTKRKALDILEEGKGKQWDPEIVELGIKIFPEIDEI